MTSTAILPSLCSRISILLFPLTKHAVCDCGITECLSYTSFPGLSAVIQVIHQQCLCFTRFSGMGYSTLCFWHLLPRLSSCDSITHFFSFLCPSHAGFACVNVHFNAKVLATPPSQMLSAAVRAIQPGCCCCAGFFGDNTPYCLM